MLDEENRFKGVLEMNDRLIDRQIISGILEGYTAVSYKTHELLLERIQDLEKSVKELKEGLPLRKIDDHFAMEEIKTYIIEQKRAGITKISILDLIDTLNK